MLENKNILIGVTGGISAYKVAELISLLRYKGGNVRVIMTKNATKFITPLTLETLSKNKVYVDMFSEEYKLGLWIKNNTEGVGTLTFIEDENLRFGSLLITLRCLTALEALLFTSRLCQTVEN